MGGEILKAPENLTHPRDYSAPSVGNAAQTEGSGKGQIDKLSIPQIFNNASQSKGDSQMAPSEWGAVSYSPSKSSAEAGTATAGGSYSVDLVSGQNSCWHGGKSY